MCLHPDELQTVITPDQINCSDETSASFLCLEKSIFRQSYCMLGLGLPWASCQVTGSSHSPFSTCTLKSLMASAHNKATPGTEQKWSSSKTKRSDSWKAHWFAWHPFCSAVCSPDPKIPVRHQVLRTMRTVNSSRFHRPVIILPLSWCTKWHAERGFGRSSEVVL